MNERTSRERRKWTWAKRWREKRAAYPQRDDERLKMLEEIEQAKKDWIIARQKLDYVTEKDQIDYAIFALEAAEKRYEMLLRNAKKNGLTALDPTTGRWPETESRASEPAGSRPQKQADGKKQHAVEPSGSERHRRKQHDQAQ